MIGRRNSKTHTGRKRGLAVALLSAGLILFSLVVAIMPAKVSAAAFANVSESDVQSATYNWVNESTIAVTIGSTTSNFTDPSGIQDYTTTHRGPFFKFINNTTCKESDLWANAATPAKIDHGYIYYQLSSNGNCVKYNLPGNSAVATGQTGNSDIIYNLTGTSITRVDGASWYTFTPSSIDPDLYIISAAGSKQKTCLDTIVTNDSDTATLWELNTSDHGKGQPPKGIGVDGCYVSDLTDDVNGPALSKPTDSPNPQCPNALILRVPMCSDHPQNADGSFTIHLADSSSTGAGGAATAGTADGTGTAPEINCGVQWYNPLSWVLCPLSSALETVISGLDDEINNYLDIKAGDGSYDTSSCSSTDQWCNYYKSWSVIRDLSLALVVVFALIAIVSQALGLEIFDAYTLRKTLPRLLVAVIGITLSWPLMMFFISLTNSLGIGVRSLIYAPFSGSDFNKIALGGGGQWIAAILGVGGVAISGLGFMGLLSFAATGALAAALAFLVLTLRQMLVVLLVIFGPIAIVCYILPNTQKAWKLWWDSFSRGLLMFPIISAFIAIGRVFAAVNSQNTSSINQIIAFTAYFAPYFLIPFTFRLAGGAIATIGGLVNDRGKGAFDRLRKFRGDDMARGRQANRGYSRFSNRNRFTRGLNAVLGGISNNPAGLLPTEGGRVRRANSRLAYQAAAAESDRFKIWANDDGVQRALSTGSNAAADAWANEAGLSQSDRNRRLNSVAVAKRIGINQATAMAGFNRLGQMGYGFSDRELADGRVETAHDQMLAVANRLAGGNASVQRRLIDDFEYNSKAAGRFDMSRGGEDQNASQHEQMWTRWNNGGLYQQSNAKGDNMNGFARHFSSELALTGTDSESITRRARAAQFFEEIREMKPNTQGAVNESINAALNDGTNGANLNRAYYDIGTTNAAVTGTPIPADRTAGQEGRSWVAAQARHYQRPDPDRLAEGG